MDLDRFTDGRRASGSIKHPNGLDNLAERNRRRTPGEDCHSRSRVKMVPSASLRRYSPVSDVTCGPRNLNLCIGSRWLDAPVLPTRHLAAH